MAGKQAEVRPQRGPKRLLPTSKRLQPGGGRRGEKGRTAQRTPFLARPPGMPPAQAQHSHFPLPLELGFFLLLLPLLLLVQAAALAHRAPEDVDAVRRGRGALALALPVAAGGGGRVGAGPGPRLPAPVAFALPGLGALPRPLLLPRAGPRAAPVLLVVLGALGVLGAG